MTKRRRFLPKHVSVMTDRHGKDRLRFRRKGQSHYFTAAFGTPAFKAEYDACMAGSERPAPTGGRAAPGTLDDLCTRYLAVPERLGPTPATQAKIRRIIDGFRDGRGDWPVAPITFEHIDAIVAAKRVRGLAQTSAGPRLVGGPEAARKLRKELIRLFAFARKVRLHAGNPAADSSRVKVAAGERSTGFHTWTEPEIAQYRAHHALGTQARLAMELMLWTCQRRIDAIRLGRQHIRDGRITLRQSKTGTTLILLIAPQLLEAIVATPRAPGQLTFLVTDRGLPFTNAGFGNKMREWCDAAGLPQCSAHGLRKAMMRRT
ncbi:MAG: integrase, partial [Sphingomonadaceae bacterium]|nr:integrase [Sphingomonadaceae bacterium]